MRTKKTNKKLSLKKMTVSSLSEGMLRRVNGGEPKVRALRTRYTGCNYEFAGDNLLTIELSLCDQCG